MAHSFPVGLDSYRADSGTLFPPSWTDLLIRFLTAQPLVTFAIFTHAYLIPMWVGLQLMSSFSALTLH